MQRPQLRTGCSDLCVASTYHHPAFVATRCVSVPPPRVCCNLLCFFVPVHGGQCRDHSSERDAVNSVWRARTTTPRLLLLLLLCFLVPVHCVLCLPFVHTPTFARALTHRLICFVLLQLGRALQSGKLTWLVLGEDPAARSHRVEQFTAL